MLASPVSVRSLPAGFFRAGAGFFAAAGLTLGLAEVSEISAAAILLSLDWAVREKRPLWVYTQHCRGFSPRDTGLGQHCGEI